MTTRRMQLLCALASAVPAVLATEPCVDMKSAEKCQIVMADGYCPEWKGEKQCQKTCEYCCKNRERRKLSPRKLSPLFGSFARTGDDIQAVKVGVENTDTLPFCDELCDDGTIPPCAQPEPVPAPVAAPTAAPTSFPGETVFFSKVPEDSVLEVTVKSSLNWKLSNLIDDDMDYVAFLMTDGDPPPMANTKSLGFESNSIGDVGMTTFADALSGALDNCEDLWLNKNQIGNAGLTAFADAIGTSPLPLAKLTFLDLQGTKNTYNYTGIKALSTAISNGALPSLERMNLDYERAGLTEDQSDEIDADVGWPDVVIHWI